MRRTIMIRATKIVLSRNSLSVLGVSTTSSTWDCVGLSVILSPEDFGPRKLDQDIMMMELSRRVLVPIPITMEIQGC